MERFEKSDGPDILVRQLHFRRDWKVSAIGCMAAACQSTCTAGRGQSGQEVKPFFLPTIMKS